VLVPMLVVWEVLWMPLGRCYLKVFLPQICHSGKLPEMGSGFVLKTSFFRGRL
jgi:hypothetical protein